MVETKEKAPRTGALKVQVEDIDRRVVLISQLVEAIQVDVEEMKKDMVSLQSLRDAFVSSIDQDNPSDGSDQQDTLNWVEQYIRTFNMFLNSSMITNAVDPSAEQSLNEIIDQHAQTT